MCYWEKKIIVLKNGKWPMKPKEVKHMLMPAHFVSHLPCHEFPGLRSKTSFEINEDLPELNALISPCVILLIYHVRKLCLFNYRYGIIADLHRK